jgi:hypothetical protein
MLYRLSTLAVLAVALTAVGCGSSMPAQNEVVVPEPLADASGAYLAPYRADGSVADWVVDMKAAKLLGDGAGRVGSEAAGDAGVKAGAKAGGLFGAVAGGVAGSVLGKKAASAVAKKAVMEAVGGEEGLRAASDQSFNDIDDLAVWLYAVHGSDDDFAEVKQATVTLYPELDKRWTKAIQAARRG